MVRFAVILHNLLGGHLYDYVWWPCTLACLMGVSWSDRPRLIGWPRERMLKFSSWKCVLRVRRRNYSNLKKIKDFSRRQTRNSSILRGSQMVPSSPGIFILIAKKRVGLAGSGRYSRRNFGIETSDDVCRLGVNRLFCDLHSRLFEHGICVSIHTGGSKSGYHRINLQVYLPDGGKFITY